jgi:carboxyl-terminal processing protease
LLCPALVTLCACLAASAQPISCEEKQDVLGDLAAVLRDKAFVPGADMGRWPEHLERQRAAIDAASEQTDFVRAVNRALQGLGVSHLRLRTPAAGERRLHNSAMGVGLMAHRADEAGGGLAVVDLYPKSPAAGAGVEPGDTIVQVDGHTPDSPADLSGADGTEVAITVRKADGQVRELKLMRQTFSTIRPDTLTRVGDDAAVLKIHSFGGGYDRATVERLVAEAGAVKILIMDLRSNGGGAVTNLRHFLGLFLPQGTLVGTFVSRQALAAYIDAGCGDGADVPAVAAWWSRKFRTAQRDAAPFRGRIAVLVDRGSASASEITAAALREILGAPLVGSRTAGAVLESRNAPLAHGFEVQFPADDYVTIKGVRLERHPLEPDVSAPRPRLGGDDAAVAKALELLRK